MHRYNTLRRFIFKPAAVGRGNYTEHWYTVHDSDPPGPKLYNVLYASARSREQQWDPTQMRQLLIAGIGKDLRNLIVRIGKPTATSLPFDFDFDSFGWITVNKPIWPYRI